MKILVVDDDPDFAETVADILATQDHHIELAYSGEEALAKMDAFHFDLTFMDVKLPGMSGVESFLEIRKRKPQAKVILMTGFSMEHVLDQALKNGAWAILKKPLDIPDLLRRVDEISPEGTILIVDDDLDFVGSIQSILEFSGYSVMVAADGKEGIEALKRNEADLLLLDIRLPDMNGLEVYLELRKNDLRIPVIVITGYPEEEAGRISLMNSSSHTGVLVKPIDPSILCKTIDDLMSSSDSRGSLGD